jgi:hypothetical protein
MPPLEPNRRSGADTHGDVYHESARIESPSGRQDRGGRGRQESRRASRPARAPPTAVWRVRSRRRAHRPHASADAPLARSRAAGASRGVGQSWRQLPGAEKAEFKHTRFLWLKNPENLAQAEHTRLSALLRLNSPIVRACLLKEDLSRFWSYRGTTHGRGPRKLARPTHP